MASSVPHATVVADIQVLVGLHAQSGTTKGKKAVHQPSAPQPKSSHPRPIQTSRKSVGKPVAPNSSKIRKSEPRSKPKSSSRGLSSSIHQLEVKVKDSISREATSPKRSVASASYAELSRDPTIGYPSYGEAEDRDLSDNGQTGYYTSVGNQNSSNQTSYGKPTRYYERENRRFNGRDERLYSYSGYESSHYETTHTGYAQVESELEDADFAGGEDIGYGQSGYFDYSGQNNYDYNDYDGDEYNECNTYDDYW